MVVRYPKITRRSESSYVKLLCAGVVSEVIPRRSVGEDGNAWRDLPNRVAYGTALVCCRETFFPRRATSRTTALLTCSAFSRDFVSCQTFHTLAYHSLPVTA